MVIMNKKKTILRSLVLLPFFLALAIIISAQTQKAPQLGKSPLKEVIAAMTLEEKAKLVVGSGFRMPGDSADLAAKLQLLMRGPLLRRKLGENARRTVIERYSSDNLASQVEAFYRHILKE